MNVRDPRMALKRLRMPQNALWRASGKCFGGIPESIWEKCYKLAKTATITVFMICCKKYNIQKWLNNRECTMYVVKITTDFYEISIAFLKWACYDEDSSNQEQKGQTKMHLNIRLE